MNTTDDISLQRTIPAAMTMQQLRNTNDSVDVVVAVPVDQGP
jgi:hypothetical protein